MTNLTPTDEARAKRELTRKIKTIELEARRKAIRERPQFLGLQTMPSATLGKNQRLQEVVTSAVNSEKQET